MKKLFMRNKAETGHGVLDNNWFMMKFLFKNAPWLIIGKLFFAVSTSLPWTMTEVLMVKYVIDVVQYGTDLTQIYRFVFLFVILMIVGEFGGAIFGHIYSEKKQEQLFMKIQSKLYDKAVSMDLAAYDDPEYYDNFIFAMDTAQDRITGMLEGIVSLFAESIGVVSVAAVIISIDPFAIVLIVAAALAMMPLGNLIAKKIFERKDEINPLERKNLYFSRLFYLVDYAKEIRLSHVSGLFMKRFSENAKTLENTSKKHSKKIWKIAFFQESFPFTLLINFVLVIYLGYKAIELKTIGIGDFVATINGAIEIGYEMFFLFGYSFRMFKENGLFIEKFRTFLEYDIKIKDGKDELITDEPKKISLRNVSFIYPNTEKPVLKNINLDIEPYQKIAFVGYNGAGKTTLTNVLMRLYDVSDGSVFVDGKDIREYTLNSYRSKFSAVFQDFRLFAASLAENVSMDSHPEKERVIEALKESGFESKLESLPDGVDSGLLREFDDEGIMLSGGEEQKVAIAGTFYKKTPFIILDEPSSNLDPMSEYNLNEAMARAAKEKTVIFISHRLSTTRMADVIYMIDNGEIVERGNHDELMAMNGKYAEMFLLQAERYNSGIEE